MIKAICALLFASAAAALKVGSMEVDLQEVHLKHLELARQLMDQQARRSALAGPSYLRMEPRFEAFAEDNTTSEGFVFSALADDSNCTDWIGGAIFRADTCLWGATSFHCEGDEVTQELFHPFHDNQCTSDPIWSVNYSTNACEGARDDGLHNVVQCGTPESAVWMVPRCGNATDPDFATFQSTEHCFGQVKYSCGPDGSTNLLFWQQSGCEGNPTFGQKIADDGECVQGFTLSCKQQ